LAIRALAHTPDTVSMVVAGGGAERRGLERLAQRLSISDRVTFLGRVTREKVFELLAEAAAVVFPGLREEGGVALAEAMLSGAPVIVLAHGGARTVAESAVDPQRVALIPPGSVNETVQRFGRAMTAFADDPPTASEPNLDQASARRKLEEIYQEVMRGRRSR
jgi:1,2-diacylglycerol 3-alpha-glucosyltransferase